MVHPQNGDQPLTNAGSGEPARAPEYASWPVLKWTIFRAYPVTRTVIGLTRQVFDVFDYCDG
ncbi:hypothetical protein Poly51_61930 [Rubripirellula tenax]|uniref:Uncharacterized protein n=1 Tax=Rubripirellula tenax TaxID=2528015 RepID=A0A5C6E7M7_9BACT|nr:hypothetical protein Poly51_61930 [Rubripirellula tenax]